MTMLCWLGLHRWAECRSSKIVSVNKEGTDFAHIGTLRRHECERCGYRRIQYEIGALT